MTNLLKAEMFKLKRNKSFWVIALIVAGLSGLLHYLVLIDWWSMTGTVFNKAGLGNLNGLAPFIILLFFNLIVSPLAGFFLSVEFSNSRVIKNQMMSGNKRSHIFLAKFVVFSFAAILITVIIPLIIGILMTMMFGYGDMFDHLHLLFLGRAFLLFTLHLLSYTAIMTILAIMTEDSGKTIIFSILFTIIIFAIEKFAFHSSVQMMYEHTFFHQLNEAFTFTLSNAEIVKSFIIGVVSLFFILFVGVIAMKRKEIK